MITVLTGENSFEVKEALDAILDSFNGQPERIDGEQLELKNVPDLLMGMTLFSQNRLVIIKDLSKNKSIWDKLPDWLDKISDDIHLVLVDEKLDKRTSAYKALKQAAKVNEYPKWTERDTANAEAWVVDRTKTAGLKLDKKIAHYLVDRVGTDQWLLAQAIDKLAFVDEINQDIIDDIIEPSAAQNVFQLFELALNGKAQAVKQMIDNLQVSQDPYQLFGLITSQSLQLLAITSAGADDNPVKDFGMHPFVASKLKNHAKNLNRQAALDLVKTLADTDADIKVSKAEPWVLIERALLAIAHKNNP